jgi:hypothetical protein
LSDINVSNNKVLSNFDAKIISLLKNLQVINIENNPLQILLQSLPQEESVQDPLCASPEALQGQSLLKVDMTECHTRHASAVAAGDSEGISMVVVIICVSTALVISGLGILLFYCRGAKIRGVRGGEGTRFSQIEAGNGMRGLLDTRMLTGLWQ